MDIKRMALLMAVAMTLTGCASQQMIETGRIVYSQDAHGNVVAEKEMIPMQSVTPTNLGDGQLLCDLACLKSL